MMKDIINPQTPGTYAATLDACTTETVVEDCGSDAWTCMENPDIGFVCVMECTTDDDCIGLDPYTTCMDIGGPMICFQAEPSCGDYNNEGDCETIGDTCAWRDSACVDLEMASCSDYGPTYFNDTSDDCRSTETGFACTYNGDAGGGICLQTCVTNDDCDNNDCMDLSVYDIDGAICNPGEGARWK